MRLVVDKVELGHADLQVLRVLLSVGYYSTITPCSPL